MVDFEGSDEVLFGEEFDQEYFTRRWLLLQKPSPVHYRRNLPITSAEKHYVLGLYHCSEISHIDNFKN